MPANRANIGWYLDNQIGGEDDRFTGRVYEKEITLTAAELLALFDTSKELVAAPGPGKVLEFVSCLLTYDAGATVYTVGASTDFGVYYTDETGTLLSTARATTGFIDQATDQLYLLDKAGAATVAPTVNAALALVLLIANPTLGDGVIHVKVAYRIHETGL